MNNLLYYQLPPTNDNTDANQHCYQLLQAVADPVPTCVE